MPAWMPGRGVFDDVDYATQQTQEVECAVATKPIDQTYETSGGSVLTSLVLKSKTLFGKRRHADVSKNQEGDNFI